MHDRFRLGRPCVQARRVELLEVQVHLIASLLHLSESLDLSSCHTLSKNSCPLVPLVKGVRIPGPWIGGARGSRSPDMSTDPTCHKIRGIRKWKWVSLGRPSENGRPFGHAVHFKSNQCTSMAIPQAPSPLVSGRHLAPNRPRLKPASRVRVSRAAAPLPNTKSSAPSSRLRCRPVDRGSKRTSEPFGPADSRDVHATRGI